MLDTEKPACPHCGSQDVVYKTKAAVWECQSCEERFTQPPDSSHYLDSQTHDSKTIFFSYGHDDNKDLVDKFKVDLEKRGHKVWIDYKEIGTWNDWRGKITQGIHDSQMVIAFLSRHATRDPGVCRNEVAMALNAFGTVYPVLLEPYQQVTPPVTISHLQWQDLSQWRDIRDGKIAGIDWARWYEERLIQIITLVEGEATEFQGDINGLREVLKPISFTSDIARHIPDFTGRQWVFDAYQNWLDNQPQSRMFWIKAGPGVGKSAIAAMLTHTCQSAIVSAWFCQSNSSERRDAHSALCSIAFQLATRWDDYRRKLRFQLGFNASTKPEDWVRLREDLMKKNEADLFNFLFLEPLTGLIWRDHRLVIVIDALDEASDASGQNPLVDLLVTRLANLPTWLNFVVTSRPNPEVVAKLQAFAPFELDTEDKRNREDLANYLQSGLTKRADFCALSPEDQMRIQKVLLDNSDGMILYLQQILKGLDEGSIKLENIDQIPKGLGSLYRIAFDHLYGGDKLETVYDAEVKPLLELLLAAPEPIPPALAQQVLGWDKAMYLRRRNRLGSYVIDTPQGSKLFHKTLCEWLCDESSSTYYIDTIFGNEVFVHFAINEFKLPRSTKFGKIICEWTPLFISQLVDLSRVGILKVDDMVNFITLMLAYRINHAIEIGDELDRDGRIKWASLVKTGEWLRNHVEKEEGEIDAQAIYELIDLGSDYIGGFSWYSNFSFQMASLLTELYEKHQTNPEYALEGYCWIDHNVYDPNDRIPEPWLENYRKKIKAVGDVVRGCTSEVHLNVIKSKNPIVASALKVKITRICNSNLWGYPNSLKFLSTSLSKEFDEIKKKKLAEVNKAFDEENKKLSAIFSNDRLAFEFKEEGPINFKIV